MNYTALKVVAAVHKIFAVLIWVGLAFSVYTLISSEPGMFSSPSGGPGALNIYFALVVGFTAFIGLLSYAAGELIELAMNVATDVQAIAEESRKPKVVAAAAQ